MYMNIAARHVTPTATVLPIRSSDASTAPTHFGNELHEGCPVAPGPYPVLSFAPFYPCELAVFRGIELDGNRRIEFQLELIFPVVCGSRRKTL